MAGAPHRRTTMRLRSPRIRAPRARRQPALRGERRRRRGCPQPVGQLPARIRHAPATSGGRSALRLWLQRPASRTRSSIPGRIRRPTDYGQPGRPIRAGYGQGGYGQDGYGQGPQQGYGQGVATAKTGTAAMVRAATTTARNEPPRAPPRGVTGSGPRRVVPQTAAVGKERSLSYYTEERYWTDYLKFVIPVVVVIALLAGRLVHRHRQTPGRR